MSVLIVGSDHIDYLVTAAIRAGVVDKDRAPVLGSALVRENVEAYLWHYFDGPAVLDDWDDLEDDERDDELVALVAWRDSYHYEPVADSFINDTQTAQAIDAWRYQAVASPDHTDHQGWQIIARLDATLAPRTSHGAASWIWRRR